MGKLPINEKKIKILKALKQISNKLTQCAIAFNLEGSLRCVRKFEPILLETVKLHSIIHADDDLRNDPAIAYKINEIARNGRFIKELLKYSEQTTRPPDKN